MSKVVSSHHQFVSLFKGIRISDEKKRNNTFDIPFFIHISMLVPAYYK